MLVVVVAAAVVVSVVVAFVVVSFAAVATVFAALWTWAHSIEMAPVAGVHDSWVDLTVAAAFGAAVAAVVCRVTTTHGKEARRWLLDGDAGGSWKLSV